MFHRIDTRRIDIASIYATLTAVESAHASNILRDECRQLPYGHTRAAHECPAGASPEYGHVDAMKMKIDDVGIGQSFYVPF